MVRAMVELQAGALWSNGADCLSSAGSDESFHRAAGGLSPEPRRGSGGVLDGYGEKRSFVIASDSRGKIKSMGTASDFRPFIRT